MRAGAGVDVDVLEFYLLACNPNVNHGFGSLEHKMMRR